MNEALPSFLHWQRHINTEAKGPVHLYFSSQDARSFLRTWIALGTSDEIKQGKINADITSLPNFPLDIARALDSIPADLIQLTRKAIQKVLIPTDAQGHLDVLLPIDVLKGVIATAGQVKLFDPQDLDDEELKAKVKSVFDLHSAWLRFQTRSTPGTPHSGVVL